MVTALLGLTPAPAHAAAKWNSGSTKYTTITNCPSIIWGNPYQEYGIGAFVSYWGDQTSNPITPAVGETTYLDTYAMRLGSHCSTPIIYPRFVLPAGVQFDKTQAIKCYYTPPGQAQRQVTHAGECPQWANLSANGYYSNSVSGWGGGWPLPSVDGNNGSAWEFLVPIKATAEVFGGQLTTELGVADGNAGPTLNLTVPFYTGPAPTTAPGAPTNVTATVLTKTSARVGFTLPATDGGSPISGYRVKCASGDGGTTRAAIGTSSPITVNKLTAGKRYRCTVRATNAVGSTYSAPTPRFLAAVAPTAPQDVVATVASPTSARVTFAAPADNGGSPVTSYRVKCSSSDGGAAGTKTGTASPLTVTALTTGKRYRCYVGVTTAAGTTYSGKTPAFVVR